MVAIWGCLQRWEEQSELLLRRGVSSERSLIRKCGNGCGYMYQGQIQGVGNWVLPHPLANVRN